MGAADSLSESGGPAHVVIARMVTAIARAIPTTSANLVGLGAMSASWRQIDVVAVTDSRGGTGKAL